MSGIGRAQVLDCACQHTSFFFADQAARIDALTSERDKLQQKNEEISKKLADASERLRRRGPSSSVSDDDVSDFNDNLSFVSLGLLDFAQGAGSPIWTVSSNADSMRSSPGSDFNEIGWNNIANANGSEGSQTSGFIAESSGYDQSPIREDIDIDELLNSGVDSGSEARSESFHSTGDFYSPGNARPASPTPPFRNPFSDEESSQRGDFQFETISSPERSPRSTSNSNPMAGLRRNQNQTTSNAVCESNLDAVFRSTSQRTSNENRDASVSSNANEVGCPPRATSPLGLQSRLLEILQSVRGSRSPLETQPSVQEADMRDALDLTAPENEAQHELSDEVVEVSPSCASSSFRSVQDFSDDNLGDESSDDFVGFSTSDPASSEIGDAEMPSSTDDRLVDDGLLSDDDVTELVRSAVQTQNLAKMVNHRRSDADSRASVEEVIQDQQTGHAAVGAERDPTSETANEKVVKTNTTADSPTKQPVVMCTSETLARKEWQRLLDDFDPDSEGAAGDDAAQLNDIPASPAVVPRHSLSDQPTSNVHAVTTNSSAEKMKAACMRRRSAATDSSGCSVVEVHLPCSILKTAGDSVGPCEPSRKQTPGGSRADARENTENSDREQDQRLELLEEQYALKKSNKSHDVERYVSHVQRMMSSQVAAGGRSASASSCQSEDDGAEGRLAVKRRADQCQETLVAKRQSLSHCKNDDGKFRRSERAVATSAQEFENETNQLEIQPSGSQLGPRGRSVDTNSTSGRATAGRLRVTDVARTTRGENSTWDSKNLNISLNVAINLDKTHLDRVPKAAGQVEVSGASQRPGRRISRRSEPQFEARSRALKKSRPSSAWDSGEGGGHVSTSSAQGGSAGAQHAAGSASATPGASLSKAPPTATVTRASLAALRRVKRRRRVAAARAEQRRPDCTSDSDSADDVDWQPKSNDASSDISIPSSEEEPEKEINYKLKVPLPAAALLEKYQDCDDSDESWTPPEK